MKSVQHLHTVDNNYFLKGPPHINTKIKDVALTFINPLAHMRSHTTAAVLQYVELYSLLVLPTVEHANKGVSMRAWDETAATSVRVEIQNVPDISTIWYKTA